MAITKIHPIKVNLKAALDYIENPDKTDDKMLVSSFGCSYETADIEFQMLLAQAFNKGNNLAHHLIQAFEPGETTPEQAHEIGRQLADEVLQGKYPYVLTTHIDKGHLHNHIIFCAVDNQSREFLQTLYENLMNGAIDSEEYFVLKATYEEQMQAAQKELSFYENQSAVRQKQTEKCKDLEKDEQELLAGGSLTAEFEAFKEAAAE